MLKLPAQGLGIISFLPDEHRHHRGKDHIHWNKSGGIGVDSLRQRGKPLTYTAKLLGLFADNPRT
jgi:hypothetical protein